MADESSPSGSGLTSYMVPALLAVLALAGGFTWSPTPLSSLRPAVEVRRPHDIARAQNIEARLWQDPIAAVDRAQRDARANGAAPDARSDFHPFTSPEMQSMLERDAQDSPPDPDHRPGLHVLLAMVPGGTYAEDVEFRLRSREAVVSAMSAARYRAEDEERIGAWKVPWPRQVERQRTEDVQALLGLYQYPANQTGEVLFPFERFRIRRKTVRTVRPPDGEDRAIVIWLPDSLFDGAPLERLAQLVDAIRGLQTDPREKFNIDVLGPLGSSMLRDMLPWEAAAKQPKPDWSRAPEKPLHGVHMFSWSATAMDDLLVRGWQSSVPRSEVKKYLEGRWGMTFTNTIATDDELTADLVDELKLRGVDLADPSEHAVLLYEWDTFYARTLPLSFTAEVHRRQNFPEEDRLTGLQKSVAEVLRYPEKRGLISSRVPNVHAFTYLRGIDGKMPGDPPEKKSAGTERGGQGGGSKEQSKDGQAETNRTEGANQFDYLQRVALELRRMRMKMQGGKTKKKSGVGELKAIGLMGSDFYDKLLTLQALRQHFPGVIFFTTDLDGRFVDPEIKKWTRNLVVASSFGLSLRQKWQGDAAPFRSSYQSALFLASLEGLGVVPTGLRSPAPAPRRFEIGRVRAVDLSTADDVNGIQPPSNRKIHGKQLAFGGLLALVSSWLLAAFVPALRNKFRLFERQYARQVPLFFTEKDILDPAAVVATPLPLQGPPPPTLAAETGLSRVGPPPLRHDARAVVMHWLNILLRSGQGTAEAVPAEKLKWFVGRQVPWPSLEPRRLAQQRAETERLAARRLALEGALPQKVGTCVERCRLLNDQSQHTPVGIALLLASALVFLSLLFASHVRRDGEPFSLFEGVSVWPCEICRLLAFVLTIVFVLKACFDLRAGEERISENFFFERGRRVSSVQEGRAWFRRCRRRHPVLAYPFSWPAYLRSLPGRYPAIAWYGLPGPIVAQELWNQYRDRGRALPRLMRSGAHLIVYLSFCGLLIALSRAEMFVPARGLVARRLDAVLLYLAVLCFVYLNFLVADAVRLARTFIRLLTRGETGWPVLAREEECEKTGARRDADVIEWLDIQFIGQFTKGISGLVFYPAIVLCLLIVARTRYFDDWRWPWALVIIFAFNSCWPLVSAFLMQAAATEARGDAMEKLNARVMAAKAAGEAERVKVLEELQKRVKEYREGAFTNYLDNPALKALLVPFTGAGIMNIVNLLTSN